MVVDDEPAARELVASYVKKSGLLELCGVFGNPLEALANAREQHIPLVFLDINMPDLSGMDLSRMLPEHTKVIFTTAYDQYALESYRVSALDYLLKPFSFEEFMQAALKAQDYFESAASPAEKDHLFVKAEYKLQKITFADILYVENLKDYVRFHMKSGQKVMSLLALKNVEKELPGHFMRVHRSYIVNLHAIDSVERNRVLIGQNHIPVAESQSQAFRDYLNSRSL